MWEVLLNIFRSIAGLILLADIIKIFRELHWLSSMVHGVINGVKSAAIFIDSYIHVSTAYHWVVGGIKKLIGSDSKEERKYHPIIEKIISFFKGIYSETVKVCKFYLNKCYDLVSALASPTASRIAFILSAVAMFFIVSPPIACIALIVACFSVFAAVAYKTLHLDEMLQKAKYYTFLKEVLKSKGKLADYENAVENDKKLAEIAVSHTPNSIWEHITHWGNAVINASKNNLLETVGYIAFALLTWNFIGALISLNALAFGGNDSIVAAEQRSKEFDILNRRTEIAEKIIRDNKIEINLDQRNEVNIPYKPSSASRMWSVFKGDDYYAEYAKKEKIHEYIRTTPNQVEPAPTVAVVDQLSTDGIPDGKPSAVEMTPSSCARAAATVLPQTPVIACAS
jgi:hypothetical protein